MLKKKKTSIFLSFAIAALTICQTVQAEPWLSTRFAQNCAGCHAPQRMNLKAPDRRCSLSCQGCHVNPNGGGIRSFYGKWNENRWLKSYRSEILKNKKNFLPYKKQRYGKTPWKDYSKKKRKKLLRKGLVLKETTAEMDEPLYDKRHKVYETIAETKQQYLYNVPETDPWRQMGHTKFDGGMDLRSLVINGTSKMTDLAKGTSQEFKSSKKFLMGLDFGLRFRPIHRKLHLVYESRFLGSPSEDAKLDVTLRSAQTRSLYAMVDDLPYNIFVMHGYYRPLFGYYTPDHYALTQQAMSYALKGNNSAHSMLFHATSFGTAPNVPYLNVHMIHKMAGVAEDQTEGFALNTGMRFVTLGLSFNYSFWDTVNKDPNDPKANEDTETQMHSMNIAAMIWRFVINYDGTAIKQENDRKLNEGGFHTLELLVRLVKENYLQINYATGNVDVSLNKGSSNQIKVGLRSFVVPGLDLLLQWEDTKTKNEIAQREMQRSAISAQLHWYL